MDAPTGIAIGLMITTIGSIVTQIITQRYQFAKERLARQEVKTAVVTAADKVAKHVKTTSKRNDDKLKEIHVLVNGNHQEALKEIQSLKRELKLSKSKEKKPTK